MLLSACLENETAAASTGSTEGKSAFTFALLQALKERRRGAALGALTRAAQSTIESIGLAQTPTLKESPDPGDLRYRTFINFDAPKVDETWETASDLTSGPLDIMERVRTGGSTMDATTLIQLLISGAKENIPAKQTASAKESTIVNPAIASLVAAAIKEQQSDAVVSSLLDQALQIVGDLAKDQRSAEQKRFGISNAILMPTIASMIRTASKGLQPDEIEKSLLGHAIRVLPMIASIVREAIKGQQPAEIEKSLFGHAIRVLPMIASIVREAVKGQQPAEIEKSLFGHVVRDLIKDQQVIEQKLSGLGP
ncbi:hypothetical protein ACFSOZ_24185 [Mesorhizobium newzealandense]|uniref:Uncharacterized protein n=1 Tax=Mesorhizobium newzealandense TaxID=1300302 RepID=A0ABW4UIU8_9HYPH